MATRDQPGDGWTVVLRRQPARSPVADGITAYVVHAGLHRRPARVVSMAR
jgi:hypothetical protein